MPPAEKISITLPTDLLWAVKAQMQATGDNRSRVIADCIRWQLTDAEKPAAGFVQPALIDGPTREEFDALAEDVRQIKQAAQESGAMR